ncbi:Crp/Fnr family transcriptional regulator [Atopobacter phocae]|uniref:Crp/Fnr family transcriptional regulator n=1 Tax=Atopobacter phocae TaxID=136492 RepID=UPI00047037E4|nr:Crp/Fnr family transcriptional regulator [Atopobacter phocae]
MEDVAKELDPRALIKYIEQKDLPVVTKEYHRYLTFEGMEDPYTYVLKDGIVKTSVIANHGQEFNFRYVKDIEVISILRDEYSQFINSPYNVRVESEQASFYQMDRVEFWNDINANPDLQRYIKDFYHFRLLSTMRKMQQMLTNGRLGAICTQLLDLAHLFGVETSKGILIDFPITNEELGKFCGISTASSVSRILKQLKDMGIIQVHQQRIYILKMDQLKDYVLF